MCFGFLVYVMTAFIWCCRNHNEVVESESSECWSDSESEKLLSSSLSNDSSRTWDDVSDDSVYDPDGTPLLQDKLGYIDFKYIERDSPYKRVPLTDKVPFSPLLILLVTTLSS